MLRLMRCFVSPHGFLYILRPASRLQNAHFWGLRTPMGGYNPKFKLSRDFCAMHLPLSFIILCLVVRKLSCWQTHTHKPSNTQTDFAENIQRLRYAMTLGNDAYRMFHNFLPFVSQAYQQQNYASIQCCIKEVLEYLGPQSSEATICGKWKNCTCCALAHSRSWYGSHHLDRCPAQIG